MSLVVACIGFGGGSSGLTSRGILEGCRGGSFKPILNEHLMAVRRKTAIVARFGRIAGITGVISVIPRMLDGF